MTAALDRVGQQTATPTVGQFIQQLVPEIQRALPKGLDADRIARLALTVVRKDAALARCAPGSFAGALLTAAALGLEPGVNGEAYLVAYKGECTLIVGYAGLAKLYYQHPLAKTLECNAVHEHDTFEYEYGTAPYLRFRKARGDRGPVTDFYALATLTTGAVAFVVLTPDEVKQLRGKSSGGGIADPQGWMSKKTALRQLFKLLPKSTTLQYALDVDDRAGSELVAADVPLDMPALEADVDTGEVLTGQVEEPDAPAWPTTAAVPA